MAIPQPAPGPSEHKFFSYREVSAPPLTWARFYWWCLWVTTFFVLCGFFFEERVGVLGGFLLFMLLGFYPRLKGQRVMKISPPAKLRDVLLLAGVFALAIAGALFLNYNPELKQALGDCFAGLFSFWVVVVLLVLFWACTIFSAWSYVHKQLTQAPV